MLRGRGRFAHLHSTSEANFPSSSFFFERYLPKRMYLYGTAYFLASYLSSVHTQDQICGEFSHSLSNLRIMKGSAVNMCATLSCLSQRIVVSISQGFSLYCIGLLDIDTISLLVFSQDFQVIYISLTF